MHATKIAVEVCALPRPRRGRGARLPFVTRLDEQRRPRAIAVKFVGGAKYSRKIFSSRLLWTLPGLGFLGLMAALYGRDRIGLELFALYWIASVVTFLAYALDKSAARRGRWRTPESTLQGLALIGGWPGALLAQQWLRHKSSKAHFLMLFWLLVAVNVGLLVAFHWQQDRWREWLGEQFSLSLGASLSQSIRAPTAA